MGSVHALMKELFSLLLFIKKNIVLTEDFSSPQYLHRPK